jgi:DNA-binding NarL/FixJ family response regulator
MIEKLPAATLVRRSRDVRRAVLCSMESEFFRLTAESLKKIGFERVETVETPDRLQPAIGDNPPEILVIGEKARPYITGRDLVSSLKTQFPTVPMLVIATDPETNYEALVQGADGVVSRDELERAVTDLKEKRRHLSPQKIQEFIFESSEFHKLCMTVFKANLTERERLTICCELASRNREEAALKMGVDVSTLKSHVRIILRKLKLKSMKEVKDVYGKLFKKFPG